MLTWKLVTKDIYDNLPISQKSSDRLFYIKDTNQIFCGTSEFSESIVVYKNKPTTTIGGKLYINGDTLEGKIWANSKWITVINPVKETTIDEVLDIDDISSIDFSSNGNSINIFMKDSSVDTIKLSNLCIDMVYIKGEEYNELLIENCSAIISETKQYVDIQDFINISIINKDIIIALSSTTKNINIENILNFYTDEIAIPMVITGNEFISDSVLYSDRNNRSVFDNGLYLIFNNSRLESPLFNTFSATSENTPILSDEIYNDSIVEIRSALQSSIGDRMLKVGAGYTGEIIIADDEGDAYPSGVKIGDSTIEETPTDRLVPTEQAVVKYINENTINKNRISTSDNLPKDEKDASDTKVASEKSLVKVMSWNII